MGCYAPMASNTTCSHWVPSNSKRRRQSKKCIAFSTYIYWKSPYLLCMDYGIYNHIKIDSMLLYCMLIHICLFSYIDGVPIIEKLHKNFTIIKSPGKTSQSKLGFSFLMILIE